MARLLSALVVAIALACLAVFPPRIPSARAAGKPLLLVMGASVRLKDISSGTLRRVFQGLPTDFESGKRFIPLNHATGSPARIQFDRAALGLEPNQVGAFWIDRRIRDESPPPRSVPSAELAARVAGSLAGIITYIPPEQLNASIKTLTIDGRSAGQPDYLLK